MAIPQNFQTVEQRILSVTSTSANVSFTSTAAKSAKDLLITNGGAKACQVNIGGATAVADASAGGTTQIKILSGEIRAFPKQNSIIVSAICESTDTTTLYLEAGQGN